MEKLSMCRICLSNNISLRSLVDSHLQKMYEALTMMPLVTEDSRPSLACDLCCSRLETCYELRMQSLRSEELFTQLLRHKVQVNLQVMLDMHLSMQDVMQTTADVLDNDDVKQEDAEDAAAVEQDDADPYHSALGLHTEFDINLDIVKEETSDVDTDDAAAVQDDAELYHSALGLHTECAIPLDIVKEEPDDVDTGAPRLASQKYHNAMLLNSLKRTDQTINNVKEPKKETIRVVDDTPVEKNEMVETRDKVSENKISADQSINSSSSNKLQQFICDTCQKCFRHRSNAVRHIRTHIVGKLYTCNVCKKCFNRKHKLHVHIFTHIGEKRYVCNVCKESFRSKRNLSLHILTHTGQIPYECDVCGKCFSTKGSVKSHIRVHKKKRYVCNVCKKCFNRQSTFDIHMRIHTRVRNIISIMYPNENYFK